MENSLNITVIVNFIPGATAGTFKNQKKRDNFEKLFVFLCLISHLYGSGTMEFVIFQIEKKTEVYFVAVITLRLLLYSHREVPNQCHPIKAVRKFIISCNY